MWTVDLALVLILDGDSQPASLMTALACGVFFFFFSQLIFKIIGIGCIVAVAKITAKV